MENPIDIYCNIWYNWVKLKVTYQIVLLALPDIAMRSMAKTIEVENNVKLHNITISCGDYINTGKIFEQDKYFLKK